MNQTVSECSETETPNLHTKPTGQKSGAMNLTQPGVFVQSWAIDIQVFEEDFWICII